MDLNWCRPLNYYSSVEFEWDSEKNDRCFTERGFDFAYAIRAFADPERDVIVDDRWQYGETRFLLRGRVDGRLFVVVFTHRGKRTRIISARKANSREVADHERRTRKG
jgi:uncharacterized protein